MTHHLLLIVPYFADPQHTGGFRWTTLVSGLIERGWTFDIVAQQSDNWPNHPLAHDARISVHQVPVFDWRKPHAASPKGDAAVAVAQPREGKLAALLRRTLQDGGELVRDIGWTLRANRVCKRLVRQNRYAAVVATSPLHLAQWLGARAASRADLPYVADYRDPLYYGRSAAIKAVIPLTRIVWWLTEVYALRRTTVAVDISEKSQWAVQAALPSLLQRPRHFIPSGYESRANVARPDDKQFRIVFTGWLYPFDEIRPIFAAAAHLRATHNLSPAQLSIDFMGTSDTHNGVPLTQIAADYQLADCFHQQPRQPRHVADALQQAAAVLISFDSVTANALCVPSKLYHYAQMYGDLLLVGRTDGAMAIEAAKIGVAVLPPSDQPAINAALERAFTRWQNYDYAKVNDPEERFHFRHSVAALDALLRDVVE